jgi:butyrate kinase
VAKSICALAAVFCNNPDAIVLTGGMAHSEFLTSWIRERVEFLAPVLVYPGEGEMEAMGFKGFARSDLEEQVRLYA